MIGNEIAGRATHRRQQCLTAGRHARPFQYVSGQCIAQIDTEIENAIRVEKTSHACAQQFLYVARGDDRGEPCTTMKEQLVVRCRFIEGDVAMGVDQAGHDGRALRINALCVFRHRAHRLYAAHRDDAFIFDAYCTHHRGRTQAVNDARVFDQRNHASVLRCLVA